MQVHSLANVISEDVLAPDGCNIIDREVSGVDFQRALTRGFSEYVRPTVIPRYLGIAGRVAQSHV